MVKTALLKYSLVFLLFASAQSCVAEKITVDPNAGPPLVEQSSDTDQRLAQKVTCEHWHTPVKIILEDLTKKTGVVLHSGYTKQDWQVRDRRMNVFVKDVPLSNLMNSIARVMKFKWSKNSDVNPPTYRLIADRKLIGDLQAKSSKLEVALKQEALRRRTKLVDTFDKLAGALPEEIEELKSRNAYLYKCAETGFAHLASRIFAEIPEAKYAFIAGKNVCPPMSLLSPETQELAGEVIARHWPYKITSRKLPPDYKTRTGEGTLRLQSSTNRLEEFGRIYCGSGDLEAGWFENPDSRSVQLSYRGSLVYKEQGDSGYGTLCQEQAQEESSATMESKRELDSYRVVDPLVEHPDEPDLHKKVDLEKQWKKLDPDEMSGRGQGGWLRIRRGEFKAIARASGFGVVSDSFAWADSIGVFDRTSTDKELGEVLDSFAQFHLCNWEKHGRILEFRSRGWFYRRSSQIPDEWLECWRGLIKRTGTLPLDEYAHVLTLEHDQIVENLWYDKVLAPVAEFAAGSVDNQGLMRFYLRLDSNQKRMLFGDGLEIGLLRTDQRQSYSEMFDYGYAFTWDTGRFSDPGGKRATMNARIEEKQKKRIWVFAVYVEDDTGGTIDKTFKVPVPYVPVKADAPAESK